jgi:uncharacterized protein YcbK (DUF882 family)
MLALNQNEKLSLHFTLSELCITHQRDKSGRLLSNYPVPDDVKANLVKLCSTILEKVRTGFGMKKVCINSGYRSPAVNKAVGSTDHSQHLLGEAADIHVAGVSHVEVADWIAKAENGINFGQLILEQYAHGGIGPGSGWVHVSLPCHQDKKHRRTLRRNKIIQMHGSKHYLAVPGTYAEALKNHAAAAHRFTQPSSLHLLRLL